jgi:hypothetical protein
MLEARVLPADFADSTIILHASKIAEKDVSGSYDYLNYTVNRYLIAYDKTNYELKTIRKTINNQTNK